MDPYPDDIGIIPSSCYSEPLKCDISYFTVNASEKVAEVTADVDSRRGYTGYEQFEWKSLCIAGSPSW